MITIEHAALHIIDAANGTTILSDTEMNLAASESTTVFLTKHIERSLKSSEAKPGVFYDDSDCKQHLAAYWQQTMSFIEFSQDIAKQFGQALMQSDESIAADLIICEAAIEDSQKIVIFKCNNRQGFIHQVLKTDQGIETSIIYHSAIMPSLTQKIDEFAFIDKKDWSIAVCARRYTIDGNRILILPEAVLECALSPSPKETIAAINKTAQKTAADFGRDPVETATTVKAVITKELADSDTLDPIETGKKIFADNPAMQQEYTQKAKDSGFAENQPVRVNKEAVLQKMLNHKLKTDTGIELTIPVDYFDNTDYVEFNNNPDGSLSITLKHINNIVNRT